MSGGSKRYRLVPWVVLGAFSCFVLSWFLGSRGSKGASGRPHDVGIEPAEKLEMGSAPSYSESGHRVPLTGTQSTSAPSTLDRSPVIGAIDDCLRLTAESSEVLACLARIESEGLPCAELGTWLHSSGHPLGSKALVLQSLVHRLDPEIAADFLDCAFQRSPDLLETDLLAHVVTAIEHEDIEWVRGFGLALRPERVFAARTDALVLLLKPFAARDEHYLNLLQDGARGFYGGKPDQMYRAGAVAAVTMQPGEAYVAFMESIVDSPFTTSEGQIGCFLTQFVLQGKSRIEGDPGRAARVLDRVLDDRRFALDASRQLLKYFDRNPPIGIPARDWEALRERAQKIVKDSGHG